MARLHSLILPSTVRHPSAASQNTPTPACILSAEGRENRAVFSEDVLTEQTF